MTVLWNRRLSNPLRTYLLLIGDDFVNQAAEGVDHAAGQGIVLDGIGIDDGLEATGMQHHVDVGSHLNGVAIVVDGTRLLAADMEMFRAEGLDL